jgi:CheY-like chemotaxis protein
MSNTPPVTILVIDDEQQVRESMGRVLERAGYSVRHAGNGLEGIAAMQAEAARLVITDIIMPRQHGVDAIRELRRDFPATRILACSGGGNFAQKGYMPEALTTAAYLAAAKKAGADAVLTKPFDRSELLDAVQKLVGPPRSN